MTYKELRAEIDAMNEYQINTDVTVYVTGVDEYYPLARPTELDFASVNDVLDKTHPFLIV